MAKQTFLLTIDHDHEPIDFEWLTEIIQDEIEADVVTKEITSDELAQRLKGEEDVSSIL